MDVKKLLNPTFIIAAGVLLAGTAFVYGWVAAFGLHPIKEAVPLGAFLDSFPDEIDVEGRTYVRISKQDISKEILDFLFDGGMGEYEDYLQWYMVPLDEAKQMLVRKQEAIRNDPVAKRNWARFAEVDLDDPSTLRAECDAMRHPRLMACRHLVSLFITYYTGKADTVPHVPERCYLGSGFRQTGEQTFQVPVSGIQWGQRGDFEVKLLHFERMAFNKQQQTRELQRTHVARYFVANWKYMVSRIEVRLTQADPRQSKVFFTKIEAKFGNLGQPRIDPATHLTIEADPKEVVESLRKFLSAAAPIYEQSFLPPPPEQTGR